MDRDKYFITAPEAAYSPGGKGGNLFTLRSLGFNVPEFVVIPVEILRGLSEYKYTELSDHLISYFEKITGINKAELTFAVRSSALAEDHKQASFAGMFESMLGVNSGELVSAIKKVKASANTPRVLEYADKMGISREGLDLAIIVQILVNADISGVGFGIDPVSGNTSSKTIAALYGLGEGLVSGALDADTYILKNDGNINVEIAHKTHQFIATPEGTIKPVSYTHLTLPTKRIV